MKGLKIALGISLAVNALFLVFGYAGTPRTYEDCVTRTLSLQSAPQTDQGANINYVAAMASCHQRFPDKR